MEDPIWQDEAKFIGKAIPFGPDLHEHDPARMYTSGISQLASYMYRSTSTIFTRGGVPPLSRSTQTDASPSRRLSNFKN